MHSAARARPSDRGGADDQALLLELSKHRNIATLLKEHLSECAFMLPLVHLGVIKQELLALGWSVKDEVGYGERLEPLLDII
ncbi:MAG: hypothetical protein AAF708_19450 [Deinococcota bacterium]